MKLKEMKLAIVLVLCLVLNYNPIFGQTEKIVLKEWINNWNLLGPIPLEKGSNNLKHLPGFEKDFLSKYGGETNPKIKTGKNVKIGDTDLKWIEYDSPNSIISLDNAISRENNVLAYAYKEIYSKEKGTFIFSLGSNDGGTLWINGIQVWDREVGRACVPDDDLIPVHLKKGVNKILLKIEEKGSSWQFCARILPFQIDKYTESSNLFRVVTSTNGESELRFSMREFSIDKIFNKVKLEINTKNRNPAFIWSGDWSKEKIMKLDFGNKEFNSYTLKITAERLDGEKWVQEIDFQSGLKINYTLFDMQKTNYQIVIGKDASESEQWAASEMKKHLEEISDAKFNIVNDDSKVIENEIIIGFNKHSQKLLGEEFKEPERMDESFFYKNIQSNIVLLGGKQRGTMYAVSSFLENELGVRWYTPMVTSIPKREKFNFNCIDHYEKPTLQVRNDYYYESLFYPTWSAHHKINGSAWERKQVGGLEGYWSVHTLYRFVPPKKYFKEHPEYFSLINGKRIGEEAQLCLSNPDVLDIVTEQVKIVMRENPNNLIYSVSQNDYRNACQDDNCKALVSKYGGESGVMVWFVNQVADRVKEEFPDKYIGTLAYSYTRKPPVDIKPRENVVIRLCSIESCFAHDFNSGPENQEFIKDLETWSSLAPHLYIWDYVVDFKHYIMPYPNFKVLQPNIKAFVKNNAIGIMEQAASQTRGGEFAELRSYVIAKLLWNSEIDVDAVIDDFMFGYYGRSGQYIRDYFDLLHEQIQPDTHIHFDMSHNSNIYTDKFIEEADIIFDRAETVANSKEIKERVEMARLPIMYLKCKRDPINCKYDGSFERFNKIVEREGITIFAEEGETHRKAFLKQVEEAK